MGDWMRASARAWVWRYVEMRAPMVGRCVFNAAHWEVDSSSFMEDWGRFGAERRAERRRMSSISSVGRGVLFVDFELMGGERSRDLRAVRRS